MCGIAGIVQREGSPPRELLERMAGCLTHRGPEDSGVWIEGGIGIAHTRLSIIDLATGHQPIIDPVTGAAVVANGEIYNYVELRAELEALGARFATNSDSETALHGWQRWGEAFLPKLHGMYALALAHPAQRRLMLVRDRLGIKPLFVLQQPNRILFASELKALLAALDRAPEVSEQALAEFFQNQFASGRQTIFHGIERVLPGEAWSIDADLHVRRDRYWSAAGVRVREVKYEDAAAQFESLLAQVMKEHVRSDVPFGLFLSGGVDSAILLALLTELQGREVRTYSVGYRDAQMADELEGAQRMADQFGARHSPLRLGPGDILKRLPLSVWAADELMRDYASLPTLALAQHAGRDLKVVFSGEGGDEAFAGYRRYQPKAPERFIKTLLSPATGGFRARPEFSLGWALRIFRDPLRSQLHAFRRPFAQAWCEASGGTALQRRQYTDLVTALPDNLLVKNDRMLMAHSLEGRVPFLDHRVVEFGLSLPDSLKVSNGQGKAFLKRWAESRVPKDHLWRPKRGFYVPVREWLSGAFLEGLRERLPKAAAIRQWCAPTQVSQLLARQAAKGDVSREVFSLLQFAIWHRLFVQGAPAPARPAADADPLDYVV